VTELVSGACSKKQCKLQTLQNNIFHIDLGLGDQGSLMLWGGGSGGFFLDM
jgi:hypothetical protein